MKRSRYGRTLGSALDNGPPLLRRAAIRVLERAVERAWGSTEEACRALEVHPTALRKWRNAHADLNNAIQAAQERARI